MKLLSELQADDGDTERFARELADDLQGTAVDVAWLMVRDEIWLVRREDSDEGR